MKRNSLFEVAGYLLAAAVVLYLIALCIGIASGPVSLALLFAASVLILITLIEAVYRKRSIYTLLFRLGVFFLCWSGIFENLNEKYLDVFCAVLSFICVVILLGRFIFYLNKYGVRDAEDHLDD